MNPFILLTGGAGYIGSHTYLALKRAGYQPIIFDNYCNADADTPAKLAKLSNAPVLEVQGDVRSKSDLQKVFINYDISAVIHFAAFKAVGSSVINPLNYIENNNIGLINILRSMQDVDCRAIVFSSSAAVYADPKSLPVREDAALSFNNPYGYTKLAGEEILKQVVDANEGWAASVLRYFNVAGVHSSGLLRQTPKKSPQPAENLMSRLLEVAHGKREYIEVFGNDWDTCDGTGVRDYIHVEDVANGHVKSLDKLMQGYQSHTLNLGTGRGYSVLELIDTFQSTCGWNIPYRIVGRRQGDLGSCYADVRRAQKLRGFEAKFDLNEMCSSDWAVGS